jgi:predicted membrane protein
METGNGYRNDRCRPAGQCHSSGNRIIIGVVLVLAGFALVIRNTGIFPGFIDEVIFSFPMLLITLGFLVTLTAREKTAGIIVMAVGGFFMIPLLFRETFHVYNMFWPSIFIVVGIIFIVTRRKGSVSGPLKGMTNDDQVDYINIFSGGERQIVSENFKGGRITAVFGGIELDLTKAKLAPGRNDLEIACIFGGATIIVPDHWYVTIDVTPILGGFSDARKLNPGRTIDPSSQLAIRGAVVFGGGEVKSY